MKKIIKRIFIITLVFAIVAGGTIFIFRARIVAHFIPTVEQFGEISVKIKNDTSFISSKLIVTNKSFLKIEVDTIKYSISIFDKVYLKNEKFIGMVLHGNGEDTIDISLKIPYITILNNLKAQRKIGDSATYSINISLQYSTVFGKAEMPINKSARLKIPQPPELDIAEIKYTKIRRKKILATAKIKITNNSAVTLSLKDMTYSMKILREGNLNGTYKIPANIKPNGITFITIPIEINVDNMGKTIFQVLLNKDKYDYTLTMKADLESTDPMKESFHLDLVKNGKMELRK